ncbi:hypothetical protein [Priestia koreensis]|uniref:Uncharacterized protein n=1 Tax=Priestia koreensis TaxID=284581 RepID=A0A0M0KVY1_9BACI|nr:hypothetical protein [Priestia koreensis]KOO42964.1 hypothetical protein AMD01_17680 [Priestia koreensis]
MKEKETLKKAVKKMTAVAIIYMVIHIALLLITSVMLKTTGNIVYYQVREVGSLILNAGWLVLLIYLKEKIFAVYWKSTSPVFRGIWWVVFVLFAFKTVSLFVQWLR